MITPRISPNQISPDQISPAKLAQTQISLNPNQPFPHISPNPNQPKTQISLGPKLAQNPNQPKTQISPGHILVQDPNQLQNPTPSCDLENICLVPTQQVLRRIQQSLAYIGATILNSTSNRLLHTLSVKLQMDVLHLAGALTELGLGQVQVRFRLGLGQVQVRLRLGFQVSSSLCLSQVKVRFRFYNNILCLPVMDSGYSDHHFNLSKTLSNITT